ncbi:MAG: hypothetical protein PHG27_04290 [Massilibacteroides sp.]|nr:hypothetical protein [Massilibacteroides sp.]MDD3063866.1 hypothetical protein [Massilibacteroides sp.]MDD4114804.1 hypothetical protein [Massilibacteroides sp.]MDD4661382.1 hypothetical protein [Massilibacteroides sp.]
MITREQLTELALNEIATRGYNVNETDLIIDCKTGSSSDIIWFPTDSFSNPTFNKQVLYIEQEYNEDINLFIKQNLAIIKQLFLQYDLDFIYLPEIIQQPNFKEFIAYNNPNETNFERPISIKNITGSVTKTILNAAINTIFIDKKTFKLPNSPALLMKAEDSSGKYYQYFVAIKFDINTISELWDQINLFAYKLAHKDELYPCDCRIYIEPCSYHKEYPNDIKELIDEVKTKIEILQSRGYLITLMDTLFSQINLSPVRVDKEGVITLPDYGIEIKMPPLSKIIYILCLLHPEGVCFSSLQEYQKLLINIYLTISNRIDVDILRKSVQDLINPKSNSIHEKYSRIKSAFLIHFNDMIARNYYISSPNGKSVRRHIPICHEKGKVHIAPEFLKSIGYSNL